MLPYRFPKRTLFWGQNEVSAWESQAVFPASEHNTHHKMTKCEGLYHHTTRIRLNAANERHPLFSGWKYAEYHPNSCAAHEFGNNDRTMSKNHRDKTSPPPAYARVATVAPPGFLCNTVPGIPQAMWLYSLYVPEKQARHRRYYTNPERYSEIGREKLAVGGASPFSSEIHTLQPILNLQTEEKPHRGG